MSAPGPSAPFLGKAMWLVCLALSLSLSTGFSLYGKVLLWASQTVGYAAMAALTLYSMHPMLLYVVYRGLAFWCGLGSALLLWKRDTSVYDSSWTACAIRALTGSQWTAHVLPEDTAIAKVAVTRQKRIALLCLSDRLRSLCAGAGGFYLKLGQVLQATARDEELQEALRPLLADCASDGLSPFLDKLQLFDNEALKARPSVITKMPGTFHILLAHDVLELNCVAHKPLGTASIGEARKATARIRSEEDAPRDVVIKVKHTGVETLMRTDLWLLGLVGRLLNRGSSNAEQQLLPFNLSQVVRQHQDMLQHEMNAVDEATTQGTMWKRMQKLQPLGVVVPEVLASSKDVMVMEFIPGVSVEEFIKRTGGSTNLSPENSTIRRDVVQQLYAALSWMVFESEAGTFHCDPHEGNMLFVPPRGAANNKWRVALLDYGQVANCKLPVPGRPFDLRVQLLLVLQELNRLHCIKKGLVAAANAQRQHLLARERWSTAALAHFLKGLPLDLSGEALDDTDLADIAAYAFDTAERFSGTDPATNERRTAQYMHQHFYLDRMLRTGVGKGFPRPLFMYAKAMVALRGLAARLGVSDVTFSSSIPWDQLNTTNPSVCATALRHIDLAQAFTLDREVKIKHVRTNRFLTAVPEADTQDNNLDNIINVACRPESDLESSQQVWQLWRSNHSDVGKPGLVAFRSAGGRWLKGGSDGSRVFLQPWLRGCEMWQEVVEAGEETGQAGEACVRFLGYDGCKITSNEGGEVSCYAICNGCWCLVEPQLVPILA